MKKFKFSLVLLAFLVAISCSNEEDATTLKPTANLETLDFSFLTSPNTTINDSRQKTENIEVINEFLDNYSRVLSRTPVDHYINDMTDVIDVSIGMTTLIKSDKLLYQSFLALEDNTISIDDIQANFDNWNNSNRTLCIPNVAACIRSSIACTICTSTNTIFCLACLGVDIHCCTDDTPDPE